MKKLLGVFGLAALLVVMAAFNMKSNNQLEIGDTSSALAENVTTLDGKAQDLRSFMDSKGLLVVYSCNTCPFVVAWEDRYNQLHEVAQRNGIGMVLVNSNERFRGEEDSAENMRKHAEELGYTMPYVIDENHAIADAMGAKTTPHVFLFNSKLRLAYKGAIDDNYKDKDAVTETYLIDALNALGSGEAISVTETDAKGCSIKRMEK